MHCGHQHQYQQRTIIPHQHTHMTPPSEESLLADRPSSVTVTKKDMKPEFDTQVSALSDRDSNSTAPTTPACPTKVLSGLPSVPGMDLKPMPAILRETSNSSAKTSVTFGGQTDLPPLPIPPLDETLQRFLRAIEALQADDPVARMETKRIAMDFLDTDGPRLQKLLLDYDRIGRETGEIGSYVEEFWNDSYLAPDSSVVLNLNPFFVLEDSPDPKIAKHPIKRAASLCFASVKLASQLRQETLRPDTFKGKPLCMDQFKALFSTARVPMKNDKDAIHVFEASNHIAVLCRGKVYYFQVLWPDGHVAVDEGDLEDILSAIETHAKEEEEEAVARSTTKDPAAIRAQLSIGVLTSLPRNEWALAREELIQHSHKNEESLQIIDSALFVLVLDEYIPQNKHEAAANMLHGSYLLKQYNLEQDRANESGSWSPKSHPSSPRGSADASTSDWLMFSDYQAGSCCNRWYDKMQIIVCGDGTAGINFEHSAIDGHTALRFVSDVYAETVISFAQSITQLVAAHDLIPHVIHAKVRRAATALDAQGRTTLDVFPKKLHFDIPESVQRKIYYAETSLGDEIVASETYVLEFKEYGKHFITSNGLSPDSYVQMSMMLAYYRLYGRIVCAYEPVLTKNFYHGRTEAMRPATMEARHLCQVFTDPKASAQDKIAALRNATKVHSDLVRECSQGRGVDRHLFALKCIAQKNGLPIPPFFHSKPWKLLNHTVLSTSNCGNPALAGFGFGPVVPDGLGVGYIIKDHQLHYSISSKHRQTRRYAYTLEAVLRDMAKLFLDPSQKASVGASLRADDSALRQQLKNIPLDMISYDSYGDIWGESCPPLMTRLSSFKEKANNYNNNPSPPQQRWKVEQVHTTEIDAASEDDEHMLPLKHSESDASPRKETLESPGLKEGGKAKRRGSKDSIPVQPIRGSNPGAMDVSERSESVPEPPVARQSSRPVGPFQRKPSFEYSELSQKGMKIEMDPKSKTKTSDSAGSIDQSTAMLSIHEVPK